MLFKKTIERIENHPRMDIGKYNKLIETAKLEAYANNIEGIEKALHEAEELALKDNPFRGFTKGVIDLYIRDEVIGDHRRECYKLAKERLIEGIEKIIPILHYYELRGGGVYPTEIKNPTRDKIKNSIKKIKKEYFPNLGISEKIRTIYQILKIKRKMFSQRFDHLERVAARGWREENRRYFGFKD